MAIAVPLAFVFRCCYLASNLAPFAVSHQLPEKSMYRIRVVASLVLCYSLSIAQVSTSGMVGLTGGTFQMGSNSGNDIGASPQHQVTVGGFFIDKTEITYEQWTDVRTWALAHGYLDLVTGRNGYNGTGANQPVTEVNWYDMLKWCNARSEKNGLVPVYYMSNTLTNVYRTGELAFGSDAVRWTANGYRLPTEAEWEFATRGGTKSQGFTYSGSNTVENVAWYYSNSLLITHPVATKEPNEVGLYDMSGNVWERCWDWYGTYDTSPQTDPVGPSSGPSRTIRGGAFENIGLTSYCRVASRCNDNLLSGAPSTRAMNLGFRCVSLQPLTSVSSREEGNALIREFSLEQNYPNPFNPSTLIRYSVPRTVQVSIKVFNALGRQVASLVNEQKSPGNYQVQWNANLTSGIYFYRLQAGESVVTKKMILVK
jgi:formylglycine-generating enzyme required for sulfatase activity